MKPTTTFTRSMAAAVLTAGVTAMGGCASYDKTAEAPPAQAASRQAAAQPAGIEVQSLRLTAADNMLDLRYRVTDLDRAAALFDRKSPPYLVDQASGARMAIPNTPKLGLLRQVGSAKHLDRTYFMMFGNPGHIVKRGSQLTLVAGDLRLENLTVQ